MRLRWGWVRRRRAVLAIARAWCDHVPGVPTCEGVVCAPCWRQAQRWLDRSLVVGD